MPDKPSIEERARETAEAVLAALGLTRTLNFFGTTIRQREWDSLLQCILAALQAQRKQAIEEAKEKACAAVCDCCEGICDHALRHRLHQHACKPIRRALDSAR